MSKPAAGGPEPQPQPQLQPQPQPQPGPQPQPEPQPDSEPQPDPEPQPQPEPEPERRRYVPQMPRLDESFWDSGKDFLRRVYQKADQDGIFFMSGAIAFNLIVAIVPLLFAILGIAGLILQQQEADPAGLLMRYIFSALPPAGEEFQTYIRNLIRGLLEKSAGFASIGSVILIWVSTRLVGTLRFVLREVFDIGEDRNMIRGKWFDIQMVIAAGTLFAFNVAGTVILNFVAGYGVELLGIEPTQWLDQWLVQSASIVAIWVMFLLIYKVLPFRRIHWSTALVAATFTTIMFELLKQLFGWYALNIANYSSTYGNLLNLVIVVFWMYYISLSFVLGGEVAQVFALRRVRRRQKERLG